MTNPTPRWGLFGGSFDPPHMGHLMAGAIAIAHASLERLVVVPCFDHPFGKAMAPYADRMEMARLAFAPLAVAEVSDIESRLSRPSRTLATLRALRSARPGVRWALVVGSDVMAERDQWYRFEEIEREADIVVIGRSGHTFEPATIEVPDINSTELRRALAAGDDLRGRLDPAVERYIREKRLYLALTG